MKPFSAPKAIALAVLQEAAFALGEHAALFQAVQTVLAKLAPGEARPEEELDHAVG